MNQIISAEELNQQYPEKDKWPTFSAYETPSILPTDNSYDVICDIPANLSYFKGHFPDQAVLPGVVQINWANDLAKRIFKYEEFRGVNSLKFNTMILPETKVILSLTLSPKKHTVKFRYTSITEDDSMTEEKDEILFSSGIFVFSEAK